MTEESLIVNTENKFLLEISEFVGNNPEVSFIDLLTNTITKSVQDTLKKNISQYIQEQITPTLRNLEVSSALQVSKSNELYSELKKVIEHLSTQLSKTNENFNQIKASFVTQSEKIENVQKIVVKKADLFELQAFARELSTMTPLNTFYSFQEWAKNLASKSETENLLMKLNETNEILTEKPSFEYVHNENSKIVVEARSDLNKEKGLILRKLGKVKESQSQNQEKIDMAHKKIKQSGEILSKKINEVMELITSKPWVNEFCVINEDLNKKATKSELQELMSVLSPKLDNSLNRSLDIERDLKEYTEVLARFDEVILTKSSKEDLKGVQKLMELMMKKLEIEPVLADFSEKFKIIDGKLGVQSRGIEEVSKEIASYAAVSALLKTQTKDYAKIMESLKIINEAMKHKADKADIHNIFDIVGYREDVLALNTGFERLKELFTQSVMLQHEAIGTFIPSVDPQMTKNRLRKEIGKNLDIIIKRLSSHSQKAESLSSKVESSGKKLMNLSLTKPETVTEERAMTTRHHSMNHKRIFSAAGHKRFL